MKLSHSQRATAKHLSMTEDEYLEYDRLIDLGRDTLLTIRQELLNTINELDVLTAGLNRGNRPGRFNGELDTVLAAVNQALRCGDCGVVPGELHDLGCDTYRCKQCGWQGFVCSHPDNVTTWTGLWPGTLEEREYGLLDLNMMASFHAQGLLVWDSEAERLFRDPNLGDEGWESAKASYIAREEKMSNQIMANW